MSQPDTTIEDIKEILNEICWREMLTMTEYEQAAQQLESYINNKVKEARIDELSHVWYDDRLGLVLAHGTGINHRIQQLKSTTKEV